MIAGFNELPNHSSGRHKDSYLGGLQVADAPKPRYGDGA